MSPPPEQDIRRTIAQYAMLCDDGRFDEWADLFIPDATFHVMGRSHQGRAAIQAFIEAGQTPERRGRHACFNSLILTDGFGGTASAWTDYIFVDQNSAITSVGRYHDRLERSGDKRWRFIIREIVFLGQQPTLTEPPPG